ncbi:Gfo/Idh/MocA family oxidoreductase [Flavobacteriales bacterium]|nr:Gfo/Idh/MocA family oxidoreductase [Flavobacteriales bacterium]
MSVQEKISFAVVGCGHIGKRHAEMIVRNDEAELVGLCDVKDRSELALDSYDAPFFNEINDLLELKPDVLCVCTPNGLHAGNSLSGLNAGSHVLCEKPMALTNADCEKVIHVALNKAKQVFCVMQNRYSPPSVWIKDVIDRNLMGDIYMVQINCYWNRDDRYYKSGGWKGKQEMDGGTLFTQFSHFVDILYWLFGDIHDIKADFRDFNHTNSTDFEDSGIVTFKLEDGGMGSLNYSTSVWDANMESSLTIIGEKGSVKIGGQYMNEVVHCNIEGYEMPELEAAGPANDYGAYKGSAANHHFVIQNVVDTLRGRKTIATNAMEGMKVVEIIERIYGLRNPEVLKQ